MKLKAVARLCAQAKEVVLHVRRDVVWIGTDSALYAAPGLPELNEESALCVLDVPTKEKGKWTVVIGSDMTKISFEDTVTDELPVEVSDIKLSLGGVDYMALHTEEGSYLLEAEKMKPFAGMDGIVFTVRPMPGGHRYIAVKEGMLLAAIMMPKKPDEMMRQEIGKIEVGLRAAERSGA